MFWKSYGKEREKKIVQVIHLRSKLRVKYWKYLSKAFVNRWNTDFGVLVRFCFQEKFYGKNFEFERQPYSKGLSRAETFITEGFVRWRREFQTNFNKSCTV